MARDLQRRVRVLVGIASPRLGGRPSESALAAARRATSSSSTATRLTNCGSRSALAESHVANRARSSRWRSCRIERPDRYSGIVVDSSGRVHGVRARAALAYGVVSFVGVQIAQPVGVRAAAARISRPKASAACTGADRGRTRKRPRVPVLGRVLGCRHAGRLPRGRAGDRAKRKGIPLTQVGAGSQIDPSARIVTDSVIWDDVDIGAGATLERCVVGGQRHDSCRGQLPELRHHSQRRRPARGRSLRWIDARSSAQQDTQGANRRMPRARPACRSAVSASCR